MLPVIIQYQQDPGSEQNANVSAVGGEVKSNLHSIHALTANVSQSLLSRLAADPNVSYISIDHPLAARQEAVTITAAEYTTEPINAPAVWSKGYIGTNIGVAIIDSGIQPVQDLSTAPPNTFPAGQPTALKFANVPGEVAPGVNGRIVYSQNFVPGQNDAMDHYGHGTHVAGLVAGNGAQSKGNNFFRTFYGEAPNANLINLRVLDQNGAGTDSSVIAAIEQAIALKNTYNIRVINLSLGRPIYESYTRDPLCQAVEQAWKAGIVVVVAAGNDGRDLNLNPEGYGTINAPGNDPYVLTVGAMRTMETPSITRRSNRQL
jgi:serine protease AprX